MKHLWLGFSLLIFGLVVGCDPRPGSTSPVGSAAIRTLSSFDLPVPGEKVMPAQSVKFEQADLGEVLSLYAEVSKRSVIRGASLPEVKITFSNQTPMRAVEVLQALDTVLAAQGITTVYLGNQYVKVVTSGTAATEAGPVLELPPDQLPDSSSYLIYVVKLKNISAGQAAAAVQPFAKLPNSIIAIGPRNTPGAAAKAGLPDLRTVFGSKDQNLLILRDYSSNVRRMLQVVEKMER